MKFSLSIFPVNYGEFAKYGNPDSIQRVILCKIMDHNVTGKIDKENFMNILHVMRIKVKKVPPGFMLPHERKKLKKLKKRYLICKERKNKTNMTTVP
jgi:hypothetical protein